MKLRQFNPLSRNKARSELEKAKAAQRQGRWAEAYQAYASALRKDARRFSILVQMGHMSKELGDFEKAEALYSEALLLKNDDWDLHVQIGHLFNRAGSAGKAKEWYARANALQPTPEILELLQSIQGSGDVGATADLRRVTLEQMDSRRFSAALPNALALYQAHGLRDFDVIVGHAYRELGRYTDARVMYEAYFDRCATAKSRLINDAFFRLKTVLEILEENQAVLQLFARLKQHYDEIGSFSEFGADQSAMLKDSVGKCYGILRL